MIGIASRKNDSETSGSELSVDESSYESSSDDDLVFESKSSTRFDLPSSAKDETTGLSKNGTKPITAIHGRIGKKFESNRMRMADLWFLETVRNLANVMPDRNRKELPSSYTIKKMYELYIKDSKTGSVPLSRFQFRRMWKEYHPEVIIPKTNRFTKCGTCVLIDEHIRSKTTKEEKLHWITEREKHMELQSGERKKYQKHQKKAEQRPDKYMSVIIDGMDQSKTHLPHWRQVSKLEGEYAGFMKTHVTGLISHGERTAMCFLDFLRSPQDANPTTNCLLSHFRYIFKKVRLSYLMVGHTHEDIDQMFSRISVTLRKSDAVTLEELKSIIRKSYHPTPMTSYVENHYDIKAWLYPYLAVFENHSQPHAFRFKLNEKKEVEMSYKEWSNKKGAGKFWLPRAGPHIILRRTPPGKPALLRPDLKKCPSVEKIETSIDRLKVRMRSHQLHWWTDFLEKEKVNVEQWTTMSDEELEEAGQSFDLIEMFFVEPQVKKEEESEDSRKRSAAITKLLDKQNNFKEIKLKKPAPY
ncbi:hypothetical protein AC249_AIPGENE2579 [Exaiptasia diaphana]|nr:hypothetical protein AC249_AIPGENE2579 [Exaiptasia diaphana]